MEHIHQYDWTFMSGRDSENFVTAEDLDNSCTEKILRNKFYDPLISSESDDDGPSNKINWDEVFKVKKNQQFVPRIFIPGLRNVMYPKLSALSVTQHYQCLKVICAQNPNVLEAEFMPRATKLDYSLFEDIKHIYLKEQKEFVEWAKAQWVSTHCLRALKPKPLTELVYEAEFAMKEKAIESLPKNYEMAAQLPLVTENDAFEFVPKKDLISVKADALPSVQLSDMLTRKVTILKSCSLPKPCDKHPCRFVLPGTSSVSTQPLTDLHYELAEFASTNDAQYIASESALQCVVSSRPYLLPVSVCSVLGSDGNSQSIVVLGSEFSLHKQSSQQRTYRAFRHLLEYLLIPPQEKARVLLHRKNAKKGAQTKSSVENDMETNDDGHDDGDDDNNDNLVIDFDMATEESQENTDKTDIELEGGETEASENNNGSSAQANAEEQSRDTPVEKPKTPQTECTCDGTWYEHPPPRSFRKWLLRNKSRHEEFDLIVHCPHKIRGESGELILEPIPEYQLDLGASEQPIETIRSLALSLYLRKNASAMNVRVEGTTGELVTFEEESFQTLERKLPDFLPSVSNKIHTLLNQLQGLLPGNYLLKHEPEHGDNVLLYTARANGSFVVRCDATRLAEADEAKCVRRAPVITPILLPVHKFRKILPCAFTPFPRFVSREGKKPPQRQKTPPQALKWPKKKNKKKKNTVTNN